MPLSLFGVSGNYASALFIAASKANSLDTVEKELSVLVAAAKKSTVFSQFVKDLSVPADVRVKAIQEIFSEAKFTDITKNFLCIKSTHFHSLNSLLSLPFYWCFSFYWIAIMAENGRLRHIEKIAQSFSDLTMAHKGEVKVTVTSVIVSSSLLYCSFNRWIGNFYVLSLCFSLSFTNDHNLAVSFHHHWFSQDSVLSFST